MRFAVNALTGRTRGAQPRPGPVLFSIASPYGVARSARSARSGVVGLRRQYGAQPPRRRGFENLNKQPAASLKGYCGSAA